MFDYNKNILFSLKLKSVKVNLHVSALGMLLLSFSRSGSLAHALFSFMGFLLVVSIHELGHAFFVRYFNHKVYSVVLIFMGGVCIHEPLYDRDKNFWVSAGGIIFQLILLIFALAVVGIERNFYLGLNPPIWFFLTSVLIEYNLIIIIFNLLPIPGFDGSKIFGYLMENKFHIPHKSLKREKRNFRTVSRDKLADSIPKAKEIFEKAKNKEDE